MPQRFIESCVRAWFWCGWSTWWRY